MVALPRTLCLSLHHALRSEQWSRYKDHLVDSAQFFVQNGVDVLEASTSIAWRVCSTTITASSSLMQFVVSLFLFLNLLFYLLTTEVRTQPQTRFIRYLPCAHK